MTKMLDKAIEAVRTLSPEEQDEIARAILAQVKYAQEIEEDIDREDLEAIERGLEDMWKGRIATPEQVEAAFSKFVPKAM